MSYWRWGLGNFARDLRRYGWRTAVHNAAIVVACGLSETTYGEYFGDETDEGDD